MENNDGWDSWVDLARLAIRKKESKKDKLNRVMSLLLDYANRLDGNEQCVACALWVNPMDANLDTEGYICRDCDGEDTP